MTETRILERSDSRYDTMKSGNTRKIKIFLTKACLLIYSSYHTSGGMAEWLIAAVLKTAVPQGTQSSNLCPSAIEKKQSHSIRMRLLFSER
jgi:hypothetical protein